uniref:Uncharacterized protein n=1 Tax=Globodera pallida TaxID=36090 RepID=A0A183BXI4_GLOPA
MQENALPTLLVVLLRDFNVRLHAPGRRVLPGAPKNSDLFSVNVLLPGAWAGVNASATANLPKPPTVPAKPKSAALVPKVTQGALKCGRIWPPRLFAVAVALLIAS